MIEFRECIDFQSNDKIESQKLRLHCLYQRSFLNSIVF